MTTKHDADTSIPMTDWQNEVSEVLSGIERRMKKEGYDTEEVDFDGVWETITERPDHLGVMLAALEELKRRDPARFALPIPHD